MKKICVVGLGYIGLPTAAMLANHGHDVVGVDINPGIVAALNRGEVIIEEPGLAAFVRQAVTRGRLRAAMEPESADAFIVAVPTPITEQQKADLAYVQSAVHTIVPYLRPGNVLIVESTIPPRTMEDLVGPILSRYGFNVGREIYAAHCPERVLPGRILQELVHNDRIIGGINEESSRKAAEIYKSFVAGQIHLTDATTAEMAKLMENTFRDVNIALANELALIAEKLGLDAHEVIRMANKHPRVNLHQPGPGVGGHCLAVDPYFIVEKAPETARMIELARRINSEMPAHVARQIREICNGTPQKVAVLGVAYKGDIDDCRESPALEVIEHLLRDGSAVSVFDPHVDRFRYPLESNLHDALRDAECAVILADHQEFRQLNYDDYAVLMRSPYLLDTKNCVPDFRKMAVFKLGDHKNRKYLGAAMTSLSG